jgi:PKD repeat protein
LFINLYYFNFKVQKIMKKNILFTFLFIVSILSLKALNFTYSPANNITLSTTNISFNWNEIIRANRYKINISTSITMSPLVVSDSSINILSRNFALLPNTYYWQVFADTGLGYNFASTIYKFSIVNPALFDSLAFWVKADDIVGPNGTIVTNWNDNSLNGYIATQGTASRRPKLLNNTLNKKPTLVFDGTDFFNCGNVDLHINREYTAFVLSKTATTSGTRPLISKGSTTNEGNVFLYVSSTNKIVQNIDLETVVGTTTISNNKYYLYSTVTNADSSNLYINKNVEFKYVPTVDLMGTNTLSFLVGSSLGTSFWLGNISEVLIYKKRLSNIDRSNIDNYLLDKYAPPINLGKDTTTCAGNQIVLSAKNDGSYISYLWNTGSTDSAIRVTSTGIYSVRVIDIFDRISYDTVIVKFDNSSVSNLIMRDTAVCIGTPLLLSAGPSHLRYLWSNADTSNISSLNSAGTYWVRLTDCQNNILSDTFDLIEVDLSFNLGNDTSICQGKNIILNPNPTRTVSFLWNTGATTSSIDVINQDNYWCRLTDNSVGCVSFDTLVLIVDSFSVIAKLSDDTILCNGNGITLNQGFELVRDILWNNSDTTIITSVTSTGDYSFIAFDSLGCEARDTINVRIKGNAPFVDFIVSNICEGDTLKPINLSTTLPPDNISNYSWSFGDGNIDSVGSPVHYYDSTGIYTIQLFALSDSGCSNSMSHIISYSENPIARVASIIACANSNITLTDASIVPTGYTIASWSWNVNGTTATTSSINYNFPTQGKYPINLTVITSGGCTDTYNDSFEVFPAINLDFSATGNCIGDTTKFNDITGSFSIIQREWIFASGLGYAFNTPNPTFKFTAPGNYLVSYKAKNAIGCTDSIAKNITIYSLPNALFTDSIACLNSIKTFTDRSISIDDTINYWYWNIDGANYFTPIVNHIANSTSTFPASLEVSTIHGCKDSYNRNITISNPPIADFTYTPNYGVAPLLVSFTNTSIGAVSYQWYFNDSSFANSNLASPSFTYLENKDYFPVLVATNTDGCQDSASKYISIKPSELDIQLENMELYKTLTPSGFTETRVGVRLVNVGSRTINNIKLASRIENGNIIVEDWTGSLAPGQSQFYIYNAAFYINSNDINRYICVEAYDVNDGSETNLSNNKVCKNNNSQGVTSDIYPNPSNQSANIDVVLVQATDVNITIYNELGAVIIPTTKYDGAEGLNHYSFNTNNLANGHYYMMLKYFTSEEKRKFQISR